eukprot:scaffold162098_cov24-Tisochrysis_lutea.AAC.1
MSWRAQRLVRALSALCRCVDVGMGSKQWGSQEPGRAPIVVDVVEGTALGVCLLKVLCVGVGRRERGYGVERLVCTSSKCSAWMWVGMGVGGYASQAFIH